MATASDGQAILALMAASIRGIFPAFYDAQQTQSSARYVPEVDDALIGDESYYVVEERNGLIACGGWARRHVVHPRGGAAAFVDGMLDPATEPAWIKAMFVRPDRVRRGMATQLLELCESAARNAGFRQLILTATLPGVPFYARHGFVATQDIDAFLPDGASIACKTMTKPLQLAV